MARVKAKEFDVNAKRWGARQCHHDLEHKLELDTDTSHSSYTTASGRDMSVSNSSSKVPPAADGAAAQDVVEMFEILENASFDLNEQLQASPRRDSLVTMTEEKRSQVLSRSATDLNYFFETDLAEQQVRKKSVKANDSFDFSDVWWDDAHETQSQADLPVTMRMNRKSSKLGKNCDLALSPEGNSMAIESPMGDHNAVIPKEVASPQKVPGEATSQLSGTPPPLVATSPSPKASLPSPVSFGRSFRKARSYGQILDDPEQEKALQSPPDANAVIPAPPLHREASTNETQGLSPAATTPSSGKRKKKCIKVRAKDLGILEPNNAETSSKSVDVHKVQDAFRKLFGASGTPENSILKPSKLRLPSRGRAREEAAKEGERERGRSTSQHRSRSRTNRSSRTLGTEDGSLVPANDEKRRSAGSRLRSLSRPRRRSLAPTDAVKEVAHGSKPSPMSGDDAAAAGRDGSRSRRAIVEEIASNKTGRARSTSLTPKKLKKAIENPHSGPAIGALQSTSAHEPSRREVKATVSPMGNGPIVTENRLLRRRSSSLSPKKIKDGIRSGTLDRGESDHGHSLKNGTPLRVRVGPTERREESIPRVFRDTPVNSQPETLRGGQSFVRTGSWIAREIGITREQLERLYAAGFQITARP